MADDLKTPRCEAVCYMLDDRWGRIPNRCVRPAGHEYNHAHILTATEPRATMWWSNDDDPGAPPVVLDSVVGQAEGGSEDE